jgi:hypothetical protein
MGRGVDVRMFCIWGLLACCMFGIVEQLVSLSVQWWMWCVSVGRCVVGFSDSWILCVVVYVVLYFGICDCWVMNCLNVECGCLGI